MPEYNDKELSVLINSTLDNFGFKKEIVLLRSKWVNDQVEISDGLVKKFYTSIAAGSSAEGVKLANSDIDVMRVLYDALCVDKGYADPSCVVLETDYTNTAPGYTKVVSMSIPNNLDVSKFFKFVCSKESRLGKPYVSSGKVKVLNCAVGKLFKNVDSSTNGPAVTLIGKQSYDDSDFVMSVYFYGGKFLERWANRQRLYTWPPIETVKKVSEMEGYIVPVGDKQSENPDLEWRICYTTAEKDLISNLTSCQMKVYVLLKMISKDILKPICKELTSYVMKNVIFWIVERSHPFQFTVEHLVNAVQNALNFIKYCIQSNHLPNYMIPERNLLRGAVSGQEKVKVLQFLSQCLEEGGTIILRIPKLYTCISLRVTHPDNVFKFGIWRDSVEKEGLLYGRQVFQNFDLKLPLDTDLNGVEAAEIVRNYIIKKSENLNTLETMTSMTFLLVPEWISLIFSGMSYDNIAKLYCDRMELLHIL